MSVLCRAMVWLSLAATLDASQAPTQISDWDALRSLPPDSRVSLTLHDRKQVNGRFVGWSAESIQILSGADVRTVPFDAVRKVQVRERSSRWKGAMIGAFVGFGIAFAIGASSAGHLTDRNNPGAGTRAAMGSGLGMFGAAIGAPIGALTGGSKAVTIYAAPSPP